MSNVFRSLPSVNELLESPPLKSLVRRASRSVVASSVSTFLDRLRTDVQQVSGINIPTAQELAERIAQWIASEQKLPLRYVINATGELLSPQLSGPPLADEAVSAVASLAVNYSLHDDPLDELGRSTSFLSLNRLLTKITGAEDALVVNNEAAAIVVSLAALASGREVLVSRSQLSEIAPGCTLPDLISASGAILREVGSTNQTRVDDYASAASDRTAAILHSHTSHYQVVGSGGQTGLPELVSLARRLNAPLIQHAGLGGPIDCNRYGVVGEPVIAESIAAGADLVILGGNKLLGGPRCGILVGRQRWLERIARHPLVHAMAADQATLVALSVTLQQYDDLNLAERTVPLLSLLSTPLDNLKNRAERLAPQIQASSAVAGATPLEDETYLAGAAVPGHRLATWCIAVTPSQGTTQQLAARLLAGARAIVAREKQGRLLIDLRSVQPRHDQELVAAFEALASSNAPPPASSN